MKLKFPHLLKPLGTIIQQNYWSFYPSEPFSLDQFNVIHPVIKKWEGNSTSSHFFMVSQTSWMVVVFPIQFFWTVVVFTIQFFLTIVFWQVFCLFYSTNFEFLSGMLLPQNLNASSSFYKGPRTCKVLGPLQKLLLPIIFCGSVPLYTQFLPRLARNECIKATE